MLIALLLLCLVLTSLLASRAWASVRPTPPTLVTASTLWITVGLPWLGSRSLVPRAIGDELFPSTDLDYARIVLLAAGIALNIGLGLVRLKTLGNATSFELPRNVSSGSLVVAAVALAGRALLGGSIDRYATDASLGSGYAYYLTHVAASISLVVLVSEGRRAPMVRFIAVGIFASSLVILWTSGVRFTLIAYLFAALFALYFHRTRSLQMSRVVMAIALLGFIPLVGLIGNLRTDDPRNVSDLDRAVIATQVLSTSARAIGVVDEYGTLNGATYLDVFVQPIPRALWPDKPKPAMQTFLTRFTDPTEGRAVASPVETYANFGLTGTLAVSIAIGGFLGLAFRKLLTGIPGAAGAVAYALLVVVAANGYFRAYAVATLYQAIAILLPIFVLNLLRVRATPEAQQMEPADSSTRPSSAQTRRTGTPK